MRTARESRSGTPAPPANSDSANPELPDLRNDSLEYVVRETLSFIGHDLEIPIDIIESVTDTTLGALTRYSIHNWTALWNSTTIHSRVVGKAIVRECFGDQTISPTDVTVSELQAIVAPATELVAALCRHYHRHDPRARIPRFHYLMDEKLAQVVDDSLDLLRLHASLQAADIQVAQQVLAKPTDTVMNDDEVQGETSGRGFADDDEKVDDTKTQEPVNANVTAHANVTTHAPFITRYPDITPKPKLAFPDVKPPRSSSHFSGYYTIDEESNARRWVSYPQPLTPSELPINVGMTDDHWTDITLPNGTYVDGSGNRVSPHSKRHPSTTTSKVHVNGRSIGRHPLQYTPATPARPPGTHSWYQTPGYPSGGLQTPLYSSGGRPNPGGNHGPNVTPPNGYWSTGGGGSHRGNGGGSPGGGSNWPTGSSGGHGGGGGGSPGDPDYDPFSNAFPRPSGTFKPKLDTTVYPDLRDRRLFHTWFAKVRAHARVHRVDMLLDPDYLPPHEDMESFWLRQHWLYSVLQSKIHYSGGKQILRRHAHTGDAQRVLQELHQDAIDSVGGALHSQDLFKSLVTMQLDSRWHKPLKDFLHQFQETVDEYHDRTYPKPPIPDDVLKNFLIQGIEGHPVLRDVTARDREYGLRHRRVFTYHEFFEACMALADVHDTAKRPPARRHQIHQHAFSDQSGNAEPPAVDTPESADMEPPDDPTRDVHAATTSPRVPSDVWNTLPKDVQRAWINIPAEHRAAILGTNQRQVTITEVIDDHDNATPPPSGSADAVAANATKKKSSFANPQERKDAINQADPGDMRRVLSPPPNKSSVKAFQLISDYWSNDPDFRPGGNV